MQRGASLSGVPTLAVVPGEPARSDVDGRAEHSVSVVRQARSRADVGCAEVRDGAREGRGRTASREGQTCGGSRQGRGHVDWRAGEIARPAAREHCAWTWTFDGMDDPACACESADHGVLGAVPVCNRGSSRRDLRASARVASNLAAPRHRCRTVATIPGRRSKAEDRSPRDRANASAARRPPHAPGATNVRRNR